MSTKIKKVGLAEIEKRYGPLTFAKLLKISKQNMNDLERGRKIPSIRRAVQIARKIGLMEDLMVQLVLQDQVRREKLNFVVSVTKGLDLAS